MHEERCEIERKHRQVFLIQSLLKIAHFWFPLREI